MFPSQDFREGQSQKTLAYGQALQYWSEKANPLIMGQPHLLVRCMQELSRVMEPYVAFSNNAFLEGVTSQEGYPKGQTQAPIPVETQAAPPEEPTEETVPAVASMEETAPTEEPDEELAASVALASGLTEEPDVPHAAQGERKGRGTL